MKKFVLCSTFSGRCISNLSYDRKNKRYYVQLTDNLNEARIWRLKQLQKHKLSAYLFGIEIFLLKLKKLNRNARVVDEKQ